MTYIDLHIETYAKVIFHSSVEVLEGVELKIQTTFTRRTYELYLDGCASHDSVGWFLTSPGTIPL